MIRRCRWGCSYDITVGRGGLDLGRNRAAKLYDFRDGKTCGKECRTFSEVSRNDPLTGQRIRIESSQRRDNDTRFVQIRRERRTFSERGISVSIVSGRDIERGAGIADDESIDAPAGFRLVVCAGIKSVTGIVICPAPFVTEVVWIERGTAGPVVGAPRFAPDIRGPKTDLMK